MRPLVFLANALWTFSARPRTRRFLHALHHPAEAQQEILRRYLSLNAHTVFGRKHGFDAIRTPAEFQQQVPVSTYEDYAPYIDRIAAGEPKVLTRDRVRYFALSSGSSSAEKWLPYTRSLLAEFNEAIAPWISTLFATYPRARGGPAYWSITPVMSDEERPSKIPVGFDDDTAYLGGIFKHLVNATLAAPADLRLVHNMDAFRYLTLLALLRTRDLALISVWHPSFLSLLLDAAHTYWPQLLRDIHEGTARPPAEAPASALLAGARRARPDAVRAGELERAGPHAPPKWWPHLSILSAWSDAHAVASARDLRATFPHVPFQPKGLLATEGVTTFPLELGGQTFHPLAIRSHFFEFLAPDGAAHLAHELDANATYSLLLTTAGGLYRYNTGDTVAVSGRIHQTPTLRFLGKADHTSDLRGEKLNALFVAKVLDAFHGTFAIGPPFSMLAPELSPNAPPAYTLFVELPSHASLPLDAAAALDKLLRQNPHYAYCRALGQLAPACIALAPANASSLYLEACVRQGQRLGNIKPTPLHRGTFWRETFAGANQSAGSLSNPKAREVRF